MENEEKKEPTIKDLKSAAFDITQQIQQLQQQYNSIIQKIVNKQEGK